MATFRRDEPEQAPRAAVAVPPELAVGALAEVWAEHGHPHDLGTALGRYQQSLGAWQRAEGLSVAEMCAAVAGPRSPWSLATYDAKGRAADADDRLARAGVTRTDVPRLRRAAEARTRSTEPSRRTP